MIERWAHKYERKPGKWVFEPTSEYREFGKDIKKVTRKAWRVPSYYFHLRRGGHVAALRRHLRYKYFVRFDIEDFFGRINRTRVTRCLRGYFGHAKAREMADRSTVRHPTEKGRWVLPFGFVQSPILASVALSKSRLGRVLDGIEKARGMQVSVYVDDIIVSSDDPEKLNKACESLADASVRSGLVFNTAKSQGPATQITAFNIELTHSSLAISKERLDEFKLALADSASEEKRKGILSYVTSINSDQAKQIAP